MGQAPCSKKRQTKNLLKELAPTSNDDLVGRDDLPEDLILESTLDKVNNRLVFRHLGEVKVLPLLQGDLGDV